MGVNILDRPIHIYTCQSDPDQPAIAVIPGVNMVFRAKTAWRARQAAADWRVAAIQNDKMISKSRRAELLGDAA